MFKELINILMEAKYRALRVINIGSVGYENGADAFKTVSVGRRFYNIIAYTSPLGAGATYTSDIFEVQNGADKNFVEIRGISTSDTDTTITIEFSGDGINFDYAENYNYNSTANPSTSIGIVTEVKAPFIRVKITNNDGTNAQTYNRTYIYLL